jgi:hypothetical protein
MNNNLRDALALLFQWILLAIIFTATFAFAVAMCSCSTQKNISSEEYYEEYFYYDEMLYYDADRNIILYYWDDPYEISLEDVMIEDIVNSDFVIINNKLEYVHAR